jgi:hypothetical protein
MRTSRRRRSISPRAAAANSPDSFTNPKRQNRPQPISHGRIRFPGRHLYPLEWRCGAPRPSRERKRPSVCGFRPLPLASPGKGTKLPATSAPLPVSAAQARRLRETARLDLRSPTTGFHGLASWAARAFELQQPVRPSDPVARLGAFQRPAPSMRPSAPLPFPPSSVASRLGLGLCFVSASRRCPEPEGPLFRREKQAVRLGFVITLTRVWRLTIGAPQRAVLEPVHKSGKTAICDLGV